MTKSRERGGRHLARLSEGRFYFLLLSAITVVVAPLVTVFVLDLNRNFLVSAADTSVYRNTLENLLQGHGFRVTAYSGPNLLGQHSVFVLLLISPIYALLPSADTLFTLQVWVVYSTVLPLYLIGREILRKPLTAFLVASLALTSPLLFQMAAAPFHTESAILAAALWSYYFYQRNHAAGFWISFGFAVSCAEQAGLIYIALGLALFFTNDGLAWRKRYAKFALIGGFAWLIFSIGLLIPAMYRPGQLNVLRYHYSEWGVQSGAQLALAVAKAPLKAIEYLFSPVRWIYVLGLIGLPLGLALLSPRSLILLAPFPFYFLLDGHEFFLDFHAYYFEFAFFAGYLGLISFLVRPGGFSWRGRAILLAAAAANLLALYPMAGSFSKLARGRDEPFNATLRAAFDTIPRNAAVFSPTRFSAYLSNRTNIVMGDLRDENLDFKAKLAEEVNFTRVPPEQIDYIVCDILNDQCGWRLGRFDPDFAKIRAANINRYIASGQWQVFWNEGDVVILRRAGK
jgi:Predicted membrane protein (DUF2079)